MKCYNSMVVYGLLIVLNSVSSECIAQTWDEFFRQKKTQRDYLIFQVGALEIQSNLLAESASIFRFGLDAVGNWKGLEKEIHVVFFDSFKSLGPMSQREFEEMGDSGLSPQYLLSRIEFSRRYWEKELLVSDFLKTSERIHSGLRSRGMKGVEELNLILGNELELEDADRAKRLLGLRSELELLQRDLMRIQVLLFQRDYMEKQQAKWQKEQNRY